MPVKAAKRKVITFHAVRWIFLCLVGLRKSKPICARCLRLVAIAIIREGSTILTTAHGGLGKSCLQYYAESVLFPFICGIVYLLLPFKFQHLILMSLSAILLAGCTTNASKFAAHRKTSLVTIEHDLPIVIGFCERYFVSKEPDIEYLAKNGFEERPIALNSKENTKSRFFHYFTRPPAEKADGRDELRAAALFAQSGKVSEPSCGLIDVNVSSVIRKMEIRLRRELRRKGYIIKQSLETVTAPPKEIYARNGSVFLVETHQVTPKEKKHIRLAYFSIRKLKISEQYFDKIWPLMREIRSKNPYTLGYNTVRKTYSTIEVAEKVAKGLSIEDLVRDIRHSRNSNVSSSIDWRQQHNENARLANQQAQYQRTQQAQQQFINQARARNPAPPTGLNN